jgi:hippurate hydrolase
VRALLQERVTALAHAQAASFGAQADVDYRLGFPAVVNHAEETAFARAVAVDAFGAAQVPADFAPRTASEDFAYMLQARRGSYLFVGNGDTGVPLHNPRYDFNDSILATAATYWARLTEQFLAQTHDSPESLHHE